jgi:hypothetical protein
MNEYNLLLINSCNDEYLVIPRKIQDFIPDTVDSDLDTLISGLIGDNDVHDIVGILYPDSGRWFQSCRIVQYQGDSFMVVI